MMAIQHEARHVWTLLSSPTPQNQPGSGSVHTESMALRRHFLDFPMARVACNCWKPSVSLFHGSMLAIQHVAGHVWILLSSPTPQNQPGCSSVHTESMVFLRQYLYLPVIKIACDWWKSSVSLFHGSMMAIQHVARHVWTLLSSPTPQNQPGSGSVHTESMVLWRHFLDFPMARVAFNCWKPSVSLFDGSMISLYHVARHVCILLSSPTPQNQPGSSSVHTESIALWRHFLDFPWSEWHVIAESHQYHCLMDPWWPFNM
jgi:hypothetical protein